MSRFVHANTVHPINGNAHIDVTAGKHHLLLNF